MKLLVIEDDPNLRAGLLDIISSIDNGLFSPHGVGTLAEALELLKQNGFKAALVDLGLPDSKGLDTVRTVISAYNELPVVIFTGDDNNDLALAALREGAQDYLVKGKVDGSHIEKSLKFAIERIERLKSERIIATYKAGIRKAINNMEENIAEINHIIAAMPQ